MLFICSIALYAIERNPQNVRCFWRNEHALRKGISRCATNDRLQQTRSSAANNINNEHQHLTTISAMKKSTRSGAHHGAPVVSNLTQEIDSGPSVVNLCVDRDDDRPIAGNRRVTEAMVVAAATIAAQCMKAEEERL